MVGWVGVGSTCDQIRSDVVQTLERRRASEGTVSRWAEDTAKGVGARAFEVLRRRPFVGVALLSASGIVAATVFGPGELAIGIGLGLAGYKVLRKGETPEQALDEVERGMT
ncbi:MAG: hypothetical protein ACXWUG_28605 [Polyangiales bacterium]